MNTDFSFNFTRLWAQYGQHILGFGRRLLVAALIVAGGKIVMIVIQRVEKRLVTGKFKVDETLASLLRTAVRYAVMIICLIMILDALGVSTAGLIALLGTAGIAIGFGLRDTLGNIASGIIILVLRPYNKGDFIECGAVLGFVRELGLFTTIVEGADGVYVSVPNSSLWGVPLRNFTRNAKRRMSITVMIPYTASVDAAFAAMQEIINEEEVFLSDPSPQVLIESLGEFGVGVCLRAWVPSAIFIRTLSEQMKKVKERFEAAGVPIAYPRRDVILWGQNPTPPSSPPSIP